MTPGMMMSEMQSLVYERDRHEFAFGDTLDIKTGLILASLTFLAIQSGTLIHSGLTPHEKFVQYASMVALIVAGVCCVVQLYPREYAREASPSAYQAWIGDREEYARKYPGTPPLTPEDVASARLASAIQSIDTNRAINKLKSNFMFAAFGFTVAAFALNIMTLVMRLF